MKISIIGAGNVGATAGLFIAQKNICDHLVLVDIIETVKGKALDIQQAASSLDFETIVEGGTKYEMIAESDIIINTAGFPRLQSSKSREELLQKNFDIAKTVCSAIKKFAPNAIIMNVANPVDSLTYAFYKLLNFNKTKVFGMGGLLDCSRAQALISKEIGKSVEDIKTMILGTHGDDMVFLESQTKIHGEPITKYLKENKIQSIIEKTKNSGAELIGLLGQSGYIAPGACIAKQVEAIVKNTKNIFCLPAYLDGEYGHKGLYIGVPAVLGRNGVEKIVEVELSYKEKEAFEKAVKNVQEMCKKVDGLM